MYQSFHSHKFEHYEQLSQELKKEIAKNLSSKDVRALQRSSKDNYQLFQPILDVRKLLRHLVRGEQEAAKALLEENTYLLCKKDRVTDYSGRTF